MRRPCSRPRIVLPSAASSATAGRESCYRRPRIDDFLLLLSGKTFLSNNANTMTIAKEYSFTVYRKRICPLSLWFSGSLCQYAYRQPYLTPRHSLEKPAFGGSLSNRVEGSILSAHARDLQRKKAQGKPLVGLPWAFIKRMVSISSRPISCRACRPRGSRGRWQRRGY